MVEAMQQLLQNKQGILQAMVRAVSSPRLLPDILQWRRLPGLPGDGGNMGWDPGS
jgi:hypothetical protein